MQPYEINVAQIEELQTIANLRKLDQIFARAQATLVGGETVILLRQTGSGPKEKFDAITTLEDLNRYKETVYKYL